MNSLDRKWVAVCVSETGEKALFHFVLPTSEIWNSVTGKGPNGECLFDDTDEDAENYALCHVVGSDGPEPAVFDTVFRAAEIGEAAWRALPELPRSTSVLSVGKRKVLVHSGGRAREIMV